MESSADAISPCQGECYRAILLKVMLHIQIIPIKLAYIDFDLVLEVSVHRRKIMETSSRSQIIPIPGESGPPQMPGRLSSGARTAFFRRQDGLLPGPERTPSRAEWPSFSSGTGYLRGQGGLPVNGYIMKVNYGLANYSLTLHAYGDI
jgi:hypothetical protein